MKEKQKNENKKGQQSEEKTEEQAVGNELTVSQDHKNKSKKNFKKFLHKFFKMFIIIFGAAIAINLIVIGVLFLIHRNKLSDERGYLNPKGQMVEVGGHQIHAIVDGNEKSDKTLVFIHSNGITDDSVALEPLFGKLQDYRLVYIDRSGFGYSSTDKTDKDIDSIVEEMRSVLAALKIKGPYVLVPNGIAGLEATYWADEYPEEVESIIGINISVADDFDGITEEQYCGFFNYIMVGFSAIGGQRYVKSIYPDNFGAVYTEKQMLVRKTLIFKNFYTKDMYQEDLMAVSNAAKVKEAGFPSETPMLMLLANPLMRPYIDDDAAVREEYEGALEEIYGTGTDASNTDAEKIDYVGQYNAKKKEYYSQYKNVQVVEMAGPSRLYTYDPDGVAEAITAYLSR